MHSLCIIFSYLLAIAATSAQPTQVDIPGPSGSIAFGSQVTVLPNGNIVVTDPGFALGTLVDVGAVYLYSPSGVHISTLTGSSVGDRIGSGGIAVVGNGHYVVRSPDWDFGVVTNVGAVTWGDASTGIAGVVSRDNSLTGSSSNDQVGRDQATSKGIAVLDNGNYVVTSPFWDNGAIVDVGAVTLADGNSGRMGAVAPANSLVGVSAADWVGFNGVIALRSGHYGVSSAYWNSAQGADVGAVTWCDGSIGCSGAVAASNSLIGGFGNSYVGNGGVTALGNGHYVVISSNWSEGVPPFARGAVTWANGNSTSTGVVSTFNSLYGTSANDSVGQGGVTALSNGHYVVCSPHWNNVGAATWVNGGGARVGVVVAGNSLTGSRGGDRVCGAGVSALSNTHYVVASPEWDNASSADVGAATWGNGSSGLVGVVSPSNSLIGASSGDEVAGGGVIALSNGHYVVASAAFSNSAVKSQEGAVTWANGDSGRSGVVSASNSLVGNVGDSLGYYVTVLRNGHYVVATPRSGSGDGATPFVGTVTWANGYSGIVGNPAPGNSLYGTTIFDFIGETIGNPVGNGVHALAGGRYLIHSKSFDSGVITDAGAVTLTRGDMPLLGDINVSNSVIGGAPNGDARMSYSYDAARYQLVVGQPASNLFTLFVLLPELPYFDGFEGSVGVGAVVEEDRVPDYR